MMLRDLIFLLPTITVAVWCLWARRRTWKCPWERAATLTIVLLPLGALLVMPAVGDKIGEPIRDLTGIYNLEDAAGNILLVKAACAIAYMTVGRLVPNPKRLLRRMVDAPSVIGNTIALGAFFLSGAADNPDVFDTLPFNGWIHIYYLAVNVTIIWVLTYAIRALWILRRARRHRTIANIYLVSCLGGIVANLWTVKIVITGQFHGGFPALGGLAIWIGGSAFAAGYSWRRKTIRRRELGGGAVLAQT